MRGRAGWEDPQKQLYLRYGGDGIADMIVGTAFVAIGLMLISDMPFVPAWLVIFLAPISWGLKRRITVPRLSEAEIKALLKEEGPAIQTIAWVTIVGVLFLVATVLVTMLSPDRLSAQWSPYLSWVTIGLSLAAVFILLGLIYRAWRWAAYALLVVPAGWFIVAGGIEFPAALAGLGTLVLLCGLFIAARFVATHPRLREQA